MSNAYSVYIMASRSRALYIGLTGDLLRRTSEHRAGQGSRFAARYQMRRLVFFERYGAVEAAIAREKQLKGWRRERKLALIEQMNPEWADLAESEFGLAAL